MSLSELWGMYCAPCHLSGRNVKYYYVSVWSIILLFVSVLFCPSLHHDLHLLISDEVRQDDTPASGLRHLVHQLPGSVGASEAPDVVAPDHALGPGANDVNLSPSDELNVAALLQKCRR